ncbi:MAG: hypothetical protein AAF517_05490 [Planctomycetota bacterium]
MTRRPNIFGLATLVLAGLSFLTSPAALFAQDEKSEEKPSPAAAESEEVDEGPAPVGTALQRGNALFAKGAFQEAAKTFESGTERKDYLTRKYNAGVSLLRSGKLDDAVSRFEEVSSRSKEELARRANYNLGYCHFQRGAKIASGEVQETQANPQNPQGGNPNADLDQKIEQLKQAAAAYRNASVFYRKVKPRDAQVDRDVAVTKTALVALLDEIAQLEEEKKRREEEEALKNPAELLTQLIAREKLHKGIALSLGEQRGGRTRIAVRRLRKAQTENRVLTEKLHHFVKAELESTKKKLEEQKAAAPKDPQSDPPEPSFDEKLAKLEELTRAQLQNPQLPPDQKPLVERQAAELAKLREQLKTMAPEQQAELEKQMLAQLPPQVQALLSGKTPENAEGQVTETDVQRLEGADAAIGKAIEAQKLSEVAYSQQSPGEAPNHHRTAIAELRTARQSFPLDLGTLVQEAIATQTSIDNGVDAIHNEQNAGLGGEVKGSGLGKLLVDTLKDNILRPIAKKIAPSREIELKALAEDEDDVVWASQILTQVQIPASQGGPAAPGQPAPPQLSEEEAKKLSEEIQAEAKIALEKSQLSVEKLNAADVDGSVAPVRETLASLERILELLPKPPETPEEKLRKLIAREVQAKEASEAATELTGDALTSATSALAESQRAEGKVAAEIAEELGVRAQQDPRVPPAIEKIREGEEHIFASAESLSRERAKPATESIDKAIVALTEALQMLQGDQDQQNQDQNQDQQNQQEQQQQQDQQQPRKGGQKLTARQARMQKEEMEKKRRKEEEKLFMSSSSVAVDKDW